MGMVNTTVTLKPREQWRPGMTIDKLQAEMDGQLQFPGYPNVWTQPIRNRLDMLLTGIKTPVGIKILGSDLTEIQRLGGEIERTLQSIPGTRSVYAERVAQGYFLDKLEPDYGGQSAEQLLRAIQWARAAELFGFDDDTDELFLEN